MARSQQKTSALSEQVAQLTAQVEQLRAELTELRGGGNGSNGHESEPRSRRDLLRMAGVAAVGAAGALVVRGAVPAHALVGQPVLLGATNDSSATTNFTPTAGTQPAPLVQALGQGVTQPTTVQPVNGTQSIPLIGAIGAGGNLPGIGNPPVADYPGFAPIQGVGGIVTIPTSSGAQQVSEGLNGYGFGATGIGVTGESDIGYGVIGGSGGIDIAALGNGRILQGTPPDSMLASPPAGPPAYRPNDFEQVRDGNGVLWVSQLAASGSPNAAYWRRLNSTIPITPSRIVDTRNATGGIQGPLAAGSTYTWGPVPGATILGGANNGKPNGVDAHAIGLVGNVTVTSYPGNGFIAVFPGGVVYDPNTSPSTLNFSSSEWALANAFTVLLGTGANAGKFSIYVGGNSTHVIVDIVAYLV
ncbi:MAG: bZIP transcription factor [Candidatus Dormibacteraeota bacterium]|nr:bZIP transcription factor [Candidatus Dormibacteraeota bacterium]